MEGSREGVDCLARNGDVGQWVLAHTLILVLCQQVHTNTGQARSHYWSLPVTTGHNQLLLIATNQYWSQPVTTDRTINTVTTSHY